MPKIISSRDLMGMLPKTSEKKIVVTKNGPYLVSGNIPLDMQLITPNEDCLSWEWKKAKTFAAGSSFSLCRCGKSKTKPFCDDTHTKIGFDGKETATRQPFARQAEVSDGPGLILDDVEELCAFARFCDPGGKIWSLVDESDDPEARKLAIREAMHCRSGRQVLHEKKPRKEIEPRSRRRSGWSRTRLSGAADRSGSAAG